MAAANLDSASLCSEVFTELDFNLEIEHSIQLDREQLEVPSEYQDITCYQMPRQKSFDQRSSSDARSPSMSSRKKLKRATGVPSLPLFTPESGDMLQSDHLSQVDTLLLHDHTVLNSYLLPLFTNTKKAFKAYKSISLHAIEIGRRLDAGIPAIKLYAPVIIFPSIKSLAINSASDLLKSLNNSNLQFSADVLKVFLSLQEVCKLKYIELLEDLKQLCDSVSTFTKLRNLLVAEGNYEVLKKHTQKPLYKKSPELKLGFNDHQFLINEAYLENRLCDIGVDVIPREVPISQVNPLDNIAIDHRSVEADLVAAPLIHNDVPPPDRPLVDLKNMVVSVVDNLERLNERFLSLNDEISSLKRAGVHPHFPPAGIPQQSRKARDNHKDTAARSPASLALSPISQVPLNPQFFPTSVEGAGGGQFPGRKKFHNHNKATPNIYSKNPQFVPPAIPPHHVYNRTVQRHTNFLNNNQQNLSPSQYPPHHFGSFGPPHDDSYHRPSHGTTNYGAWKHYPNRNNYQPAGFVPYRSRYQDEY